MDDDEKKIKKALNLLNEGKTKSEWIATDGYHAITAVTGPFEKLVFDPSSGIVVKSFVNIHTGEVRSFHYSEIAKDKDVQS